MAGVALECVALLFRWYMTICRQWTMTDLRRGQPTAHKAFDEATAILAGDGLLTFALISWRGRRRIQARLCASIWCWRWRAPLVSAAWWAARCLISRRKGALIWRAAAAR